MSEDNPNRSLIWEEKLPSPEELIPSSKTLITPHLALTFHISNNHPSPPPPPPPPLPLMLNSDLGGHSTDLGSRSIIGRTREDEHARTLKRPRLAWTPELHKRFVDVVGHLGIKKAVPKNIMQLMNVEGLTKDKVAGHLNRYLLYLRKTQRRNGEGGEDTIIINPALDKLFASLPVPASFLSPVSVNSESLNQQQEVVCGMSYDQDSDHGDGGDKKILELFPSET